MYSIRPPGPGEIKRREVEMMDSHEELDNHLRVQGDQEEGGGDDGLSWRVGQSFVGPGEIKRREVELDCHGELDSHLWVQARSRGGRWSWTVMESWTVICGSRRDQEEGGGAGLSWRVGQSFVGPGEIKRREVELDRH